MMRIYTYIGEIVRGLFESRVQSRLFCYYLYTTAIDNSLHKGRMKMYNHITNQLNSYFFAVKQNAKQGRAPLQQNAIIFCFVFRFSCLVLLCFLHSFFFLPLPPPFFFIFLSRLLLDPNNTTLRTSISFLLFPFSLSFFSVSEKRKKKAVTMKSLILKFDIIILNFFRRLLFIIFYYQIVKFAREKKAVIQVEWACLLHRLFIQLFIHSWEGLRCCCYCCCYF